MNKENTSKLWKMIQEAGDYLEGKVSQKESTKDKKIIIQFKK